MLLLSLGFHGLLFLMLLLSSLIWPQTRLIPQVHLVELVSLSRERIEQPVVKPEPKPEPVQQRPKVQKKPTIQVKRPDKVAKPAVKKTEVKKEEAVVEKPNVPQEKEEVEPSQPEVKKEEVASIPDIPDVTPILNKKYTEYEFYHALISRAIRKRWAPPPISFEGQRMEAVVFFSISRSGRIEGSVVLEKSSGNPFYDQAALRATLGPLPPPPPGYPEELLKMRLIYVLDQSRLN